MPNYYEPAVMTVPDFIRWARIGRTRVYQEINSGSLQIFKIGRRTYIRTVDAQAWLDRLQQPATMENQITAVRL